VSLVISITRLSRIRTLQIVHALGRGIALVLEWKDAPPVVLHADHRPILLLRLVIERRRESTDPCPLAHPEDGGFKYNPTHGGPADIDVTRWIAKRANDILRDAIPACSGFADQISTSAADYD
jgi:hypothetical protein